MADNLLDYSDDEGDQVNDGTVGQGAEDAAPVKQKTDHHTMHSVSFRDLLLEPELIKAVSDCGFEHPSEVQHECIPQAILGTDILCQAKSGMGKTAVFILAVLQQMIKNPQSAEETPYVQTLVLCHTRELAFQIKAEFDRFKKYLPKVFGEVFYGGVPIQSHRAILKKKEQFPQIVIGTPGRILQLVKENALDLSKLKNFIIDECDNVLEKLDMREDIQSIFKKTPHSKQVMMFSATLSKEIRPTCKKFMRNPHEIFINEGSKLTLHGLQQYYLELKEANKNTHLVALLDSIEFNQLVIFVKATKRAEALAQVLKQCNFPAICIHSDLNQTERIKRFNDFKQFQARIMVATNLFGRGIDIERVNVVINYDMPENSDTYLHRVGRAGRFGTKGLAVSFVAEEKEAAILNSVQEIFVVEIKRMPEKIDVSTYMTA